tara:strand:- start:7363 stop:8814 length:1452 start_codon:yes stop_codon:yes gene_type:complete
MNISELEKFKIEDAINFHDELNPLLFDENDKLKPEVKKQLDIIVDDFVEFMGIPDLAVEDVIITGSNVAFTYTPHSDIDLHLMVDFAELPESDVYKELFNAKKSLYNDTYEITIKDIPVELYVQDTAQAHTSLGEYSLVQDKFTRYPKKQRANLDEISTEHKFERLEELCLKGLKSKSIDQVNEVLSIIKRYRQAGLDQKGEFGPENLAFKAIRSKGYFQALFDLRNKLRAEELSIEEEMFRRTFEESIGVYNSKVNIAEDISKEDLADHWNVSTKEIAKAMDLGVKVEMKNNPQVTATTPQLRREQATKIVMKSLAQDLEYYPKMIIMIRAVNHLNQTTTTNDGKGSDINDISQMNEEMQYALYVDGKPNVRSSDEDEIKKYINHLKSQGHKGPFEIRHVDFSPKRTSTTIGEASGYIPSEAQKNDPRFSYALTKDVRPDTMKKGAKAMGLGDIQRDGRPPLLRPGKKKTKNAKTDFGKGIY